VPALNEQKIEPVAKFAPQFRKLSLNVAQLSRKALPVLVAPLDLRLRRRLFHAIYFLISLATLR
jgi:hypothetical protein